MEQEKNLKEDIIAAVREEFQMFKGEVSDRFNNVDDSLGRLEAMIGEADEKFMLITEGQDVIRDVLEIRVARIEENLGIKNPI